ncbi:hypothetical protein T492DRAFT_842294 [Pavlovales sp. CCMP2436]|nr:hypothetical protein T492DRAFT_842294 [Pavlovales sp. CCMP2436]
MLAPLLCLCAAFVQPPLLALRVANSRAVTGVARTCVEMRMQGAPDAYNPMKQGTGPPPLSEDGIPAFLLMVRAPQIGMWYPVSMLKGDKPTRALVDAVANNGVGSDMAKNQINTGLAKSVFAPAQMKQLKEAVLKQYKVLKKNQDSLEWGYKIQDKYLQEKVKAGALPEPKITILKEEMMADSVDQAKSAITKTAANVWKALTGDGKNE